MEFLTNVLWIAGGFFITLLAFSIYMGVFKRVRVEDTVFEGGHIYYKEYVGDYNKIGTLFEAVTKDFLPHLIADRQSRIIGIYYDDPTNVADKRMCRAVCGFISRKDEAKTSIEAYGVKEYLYRKLPRVNGARTFFPHKNFLSFVLIAIKVYPPLYQYICKKGKANELIGSIEVYHTKDVKLDRIELMFPYGQDAQEYFLTTAAKPESKPRLNEKKRKQSKTLDLSSEWPEHVKIFDKKGDSSQNVHVAYYLNSYKP
eukprot:TRINITY_DN14117_c0_g1_i1.p1 TRINITY_DN14117_c0_g1~~TRINITY_DN14117_c0_g1_i1.p1  ORF type:complete len:257 (+),score=18.02 TRINITY_DN14117_c0_g1_i1:223-993(+)